MVADAEQVRSGLALPEEPSQPGSPPPMEPARTRFRDIAGHHHLLLHTAREPTDDAPVELEVQAVASRAQNKKIATMERTSNMAMF